MWRSGKGSRHHMAQSDGRYRRSLSSTRFERRRLQRASQTNFGLFWARTSFAAYPPRPQTSLRSPAPSASLTPLAITGNLASYGAAKRESLRSVEHRQHRRLNNRAENSHQPAR